MKRIIHLQVSERDHKQLISFIQTINLFSKDIPNGQWFPWVELTAAIKKAYYSENPAENNS